jgi:hypothetical protein
VSETAAQRVSAGGDPRFDQLPSPISSDASSTLRRIQVTYVGRRFHLSAAVAAVIASHAFGGEARR